jgi:hypothetical protein
MQGKEGRSYADTAINIGGRTVRHVADPAHAHLMMATLRSVFGVVGLSSVQVKHMSMAFRYELCRCVLNDLALMKTLSDNDAALARLGCKQLAHAAHKQALRATTSKVPVKGTPFDTKILGDMLALVTEIESAVTLMRKPYQVSFFLEWSGLRGWVDGWMASCTGAFCQKNRYMYLCTMYYVPMYRGIEVSRYLSMLVSMYQCLLLSK